MTRPEDWECALWCQVLSALEAKGRKDTSYYVMAQEAVRLCEQGATSNGQ